MEQVQQMKWIDNLLDHVAGPGYDKNDDAEWMSYFLGKKYDATVTSALVALGFPFVNRLDYASAPAMWSDAYINVMQQCIINK